MSFWLHAVKKQKRDGRDSLWYENGLCEGLFIFAISFREGENGVFLCLNSSVLGIGLDRDGDRIEPFLHDRIKKSAELTGNIADDDGRDHRSLPYAVDTAEENKGKNNRGRHHTDIYENFYDSRAFLWCLEMKLCKTMTSRAAPQWCFHKNI